MQPLLLLKQTLEATYDPGPLLINGPNVRFTSVDQLLSSVKIGQRTRRFSVSIGIDYQARELALKIYFRKLANNKLDIQRIEKSRSDTGNKAAFRIGMTHKEIVANSRTLLEGLEGGDQIISILEYPKLALKIMRERCFLTPSVQIRTFQANTSLAAEFEIYIRQTIHLPGLRGNAERSFPVTA